MAITTTYNGIEYRSRLEARWAAFMQNIGWDITYEPFDGDGYIPDFLVQGERPLLVEVKPAVTQKEYEAAVPKAEAGLAEHWEHDILVVGASPFPEQMGNSYGKETAGWLGETYGEGGWSWDAADWFECSSCHQICVYHTVMWFVGRPCGCSAGDHYLGSPPLAVMRSMWADACNDVKWRGKTA
jgi:hypothetical protein